MTVVWKHTDNPDRLSYRSCAILGKDNELEAVITFNPKLRRIKVKDEHSEIDIHIYEKLSKDKLARLIKRYTSDPDVITEIYDQYETIHNKYFA